MQKLSRNSQRGPLCISEKSGSEVTASFASRNIHPWTSWSSTSIHCCQNLHCTKRKAVWPKHSVYFCKREVQVVTRQFFRGRL